MARYSALGGATLIVSLAFCLVCVACSEKSHSQPPDQSVASQEPEDQSSPQESDATNALEGKRFEAVVNNEERGYQYTLPVEFSDNEAFICFHNGGYLDLSLDDPTVPDEHDIQAYDDDKGETWTIDVMDTSQPKGDATPARPCLGAQ